MGKVRVYELAKEMNTTSKRLMEKLAEINVVVKNHMSLLEDNELEALYKHIGVIQHDDKKAEPDVKKAAPVNPPQPKPEIKKDTKSAPRIIRTTEIIINSRNEGSQGSRNDSSKNDMRGSKNDARHDYIRSTDANSGLRAGFVRAGRPEYMKDLNKAVRTDVPKTVQDARPGKGIAGQAAVEPTKAKQPVKHDMAAASHENTAPEKTETTKNDNTKNVAASDNVVVITKKEEKTEMHDDTSASMNASRVKNEKQDNVKPNKDKHAQQPDEANAEGVEAVKSNDADRSLQDKNNQAEKIQELEKIESEKPQHQAARSQSEKLQHQGDGPQDEKAAVVRADKTQSEKTLNDRPQGEKPQSDRPQSDKAQGGRPQGDRPQYQGGRPQGDRPQYQGGRPQGDRPQYQGSRPQGDRPPYQGSRPQGDRPPYQGSRPQGDRPPYQGSRPQGDRPSYQGSRPQGDRPQYQGSRPQGDRPQYQGGRPQGGTGYRSGSRPLEIPKPDLTIAQKEELGSQRSEIRREFSNKDLDKDVKREQRKEAPKSQPVVKGTKRFKPTNIGLAEKKGVSEILSEDFILNEFYNDSDASKKKLNKLRKDRKAEAQPKYIPQRAVLTSIKIPESITVKDLAEALKKTSTEIIKRLMVYGIMATLNQEIDFDTATIIAEEFGVKTEKEVVVNEEDILFDDSEEDDLSKLVPRPPVVVVMGHVDHGKTSLLDAIKSTHVIDTEAGGITQHIGAYTVKINNRNITFLDTPGHEAFTAMRARGAQVTDIAILVVAADDGVMPQTIEAINHAKAANVSIIVAINKIDKPGANPDKVKQELVQYGLVSEEWGGDVICVNVSAKKRQNIDQLLEMILLTADVLELKADPNRQAKGTVIEAKLDKNRGPLATVLVQRGTLHVGDSIVTGTTVGRIRALTDDKGNFVKDAGPSTPVEILGLPEVPEAGELFYAIEDEKVAKHLAEKRKLKQKEQQMNTTSRVTLEDLYKQIKEGKVKDLNIIIKADVQGSVEAVKQSLEKLTNNEVRVNIIHGGVGAINEADVTLAGVSNAIIIGFNVRPGVNVAEAAENAGVDIRLYSIIYNAIEDIEAAMKGMLEPTFKEVVLGHTEIRQIFKVSGVGSIAGCYVLDGKIGRNSDIRVIRDGIVVHEGKLASLKRFKDDAKEVTQGFECGLSIERFNDIKEKDIVESYTMEEVQR
ncbi:MAG: translation initiation factor IF-2 [Clostridiaceae bacterium]